MTKIRFKPKEWLSIGNATKNLDDLGNQPNLQNKQPKGQSLSQIAQSGVQPHMQEVESWIQQIEVQRVDITSAYEDWRNVGFAFADAYNEAGRDLYHRVSRFHPNYSPVECDRQYDNCLKSNGQGMTLKTFFYNAHKAGVRVPPSFRQPHQQPLYKPWLPQHNSPLQPPLQESTPLERPSQLPTFPETVYEELPDFLKRSVAVATSEEERDTLLLGSIVTLSSCLPKVYGIYDGHTVFANLYLFVTAKASAGKGRLVLCRQLIKPIHKEMREQAQLLKQQHEIEMTEYNANKKKDNNAEKPGKPLEKMLFIPANNSTTGVFQLLSDNDGSGLIFETEGDTLSHAFKTDYGNYSDGFRKAFHHETISYYRRTDQEYVDIDHPRLSTVLSGTPKQVSTLIPNAENGLFSRFIFYFMNIQPVWKDVWASKANEGLEPYFDDLGTEFLELFKILRTGAKIEFCLTADQQSEFNNFFSKVQDKYLSLQGDDYMATVRRLGLISFRICMIFSVLRIMETGEHNSKIVCDERDFQSALTIIDVIVQHASFVFSELPQEHKPISHKNRKERFFAALPRNFSRQDYADIAIRLGIPDKTAQGYITKFCKDGILHREKNGSYINLTASEESIENQAEESQVS